MILLKYYLHTKFQKANVALVEKVLENLEGKKIVYFDDSIYACLWDESSHRVFHF